LSKTNGKVVSDVMTWAPLVVRETTNLEDAARYVKTTLQDYLDRLICGNVFIKDR
jgi:hypothetical protein